MANKVDCGFCNRKPKTNAGFYFLSHVSKILSLKPPKQLTRDIMNSGQMVTLKTLNGHLKYHPESYTAHRVRAEGQRKQGESCCVQMCSASLVSVTPPGQLFIGPNGPQCKPTFSATPVKAFSTEHKCNWDLIPILTTTSYT